MDTLKLLAVALGLATFAGLNLYLTVFVTGLAINQQWIVLSPQYEHLAVLGHPAIIVIAGVLYFIEFFADKVPWVDSLWDSVHTVIRPVGGALLALHALGDMNPVLDVIAALVAGSVALTAHGVKAGTRLVANTSPEPFTNIALSVTGDAMVVGGLALLHFNPLLTLLILLVLFACVIYFAPKIFRAVKTTAWLVWRKLNAPASDKEEKELSASLPSEHDIVFHKLNLLGEKIEWVAPCISTASRRIPANHRGYLVATAEEPHKLYFVAKSGWGKIAEQLDLEEYKVSQESKFLSENLVLYHLEKKPKYVFLFDRSRFGTVHKITGLVRERLARPTATGEPVPQSLPKLESTRDQVPST